MGISLNKLLGLIIGLVMLFLITSAIMLPYFAITYEHGFGTTPCNRVGCASGDSAFANNLCFTHSTTALACTNCNTTEGYEFFLANCGDLIAWDNNTHCYQCTTFQGYRTSFRGLVVLVFVLGLIGFAVWFIPRFR